MVAQLNKKTTSAVELVDYLLHKDLASCYFGSLGWFFREIVFNRLDISFSSE